MELSPQSVASTNFKTVKKGYDPTEVRAYLETLSKSIESLQSQATAMEARARAAVARLQELAAQPAPQPQTHSTPVTPPGSDVERALLDGHVEEAETISRTLLLAQRTADTTVAEATAEAQRIADAAADDSRSIIASAEAAASHIVDDAKVEARRAGEATRIEVEGEVQALLARREFLIGDVDHLEHHLVTQRDRLSEVAASLTDMVTRVPNGLGDIRRPLISAVGDDDRARPVESGDEEGDLAEVGHPSAQTDDAAPAVDEIDGERHDESTPPSGQSNRFLFEDITAEVARPPADEPTIRGDELR